MRTLLVFGGALLAIACTIGAEAGELGAEGWKAAESPPSRGQFYLVMPPDFLAAQKELAFWETVKASRDPADFEDFLKHFPNSEFGSLARRRLAALTAPKLPSAAASGDSGTGWTIADRREVQRALRTLGHFQGEPDGGFGFGTRMAIAQFREYAGLSQEGEMNAAERKTLLDMAQGLAVLLDQPPVSPHGVAGRAIKGAAQRYAEGWRFDTGRRVKADAAEAAYWYALSALDGEARAFTNLGKLLARGWAGNEPAPKSAALLWWAAAARGEPVAMFNLGALYEHGIGTAPDRERARFWYERAAAHRFPGAAGALTRLGA